MSATRKTIDRAMLVLSAMEKVAEEHRDNPGQINPAYISDLLLPEEFLTLVDRNYWKMSSSTRTALEYLVSIGKIEKRKGWSRRAGTTYILITPERLAAQEAKEKAEKEDQVARQWLNSVGYPRAADNIGLVEWLKLKGVS